MSSSLEDHVRDILRGRGLLDLAADPDAMIKHFVYAAQNWIRVTDPGAAVEIPYLRYVSAALPNSPFSHLERHELIFSVTHDFWTIWYPPNGFDCMCTVMGVSESLLQQRGWTVAQNPQFRYPSPELGFDFNIGILLKEKGLV